MNHSQPRKSAEVGQKHAATEPLREQMQLGLPTDVSTLTQKQGVKRCKKYI